MESKRGEEMVSVSKQRKCNKTHLQSLKGLQCNMEMKRYYH